MPDTTPQRMPPAGARVLIAMSGGVDSAAVASLMVGKGYDCLGATLRMMDDPGETSSVFEPCCGLKASDDARAICEALGIPHRTVRVVEPFNDTVIAPFATAYARGRTPNPCIRCNRVIKFGLLFRQASQWGCAYIAFGHYARLVERHKRMVIQRATYLPKDQSYVLAPLTQAQLRRACFPLGDMTKEGARAVARQLNPDIGNKSESQEICFVADRDYARVVESRTGRAVSGPIRHLDGRVLGRHRGIHHYTIGQRKGLGIGAERPLYVVKIEPESNAVIVGHAEEAGCQRFRTGPLFWGASPASDEPFRAWVQLRYKHRPVAGTVTPGMRGASIVLDQEERAVAPGQWAVYYDGEGCVLAASEILDFELAGR